MKVPNLMSIQVPYLTDTVVEEKANRILAGYGSTEKVVVKPPIDLDAILMHLNLRLDFDDLKKRHGLPDVLGALWVDDRHIYIDQTLDPDEQPSALGRFRFTLAHEMGHWELHRALFEFQRRQDNLFDRPSALSIVCRTSQAKERIELQADAFAAALLMPKAEVITHWQRLIDSSRHIRPGARQDELIEVAVRPLAKTFEVSAQAMRIRLEGLGNRADANNTLSLFEAG